MATSPSLAEADQLFISFDVGTTQSAVAVAYLSPSKQPLVDFVDRWPSQEDEVQRARVPTAILYDEKGNLLACGAEAVTAGAENTERPRGQPNHFKMQLHPTFKPPTKKWPFSNNRELVPLSRVYADYLHYLLKRTQAFLRETTGQDMWENLGRRAEIVLSHPNRWGAEQQKFLEKAAIQAGLVTREGAKQHLHFVEEAEAAASFALFDETLDAKLENGTKFVVCDAGGSTVDISTYVVTKKTNDSLDLEELDVPSCLDAGGVHVDKELAMYLYEQLFIESYFGRLQQDDKEFVHDIVDDGLKDFQGNSKQSFALPTDSLEVTIGGRHMNYPRLQITRGVMNIEAPTGNQFFGTFVEQAVEEVARRVERSNLTLIILTGGFAQSPYFQRAVRARLRKDGRTVHVAKHTTSKPVAVGALRIIVGGDRFMTVVRKPRPWTTWLTDFRRGMRDSGNQP